MNRGAWQTTVHGVTESDITEATAHLTNTEKKTYILDYLLVKLFLSRAINISFKDI